MNSNIKWGLMREPRDELDQEENYAKNWLFFFFIKFLFKMNLSKIKYENYAL